MAVNKWMARLQKHSAAVQGDYNPFAYVLRTPSPSVNFTFGKTWGLPFGYSMVLYGPPKAGKSVLCNAFIGQLHRDDPEAIALKFNTEMREEGQLTPEQANNWGIDPDRYQAYNTNVPSEIFDFIENEVAAMCQEGAKIKLIIIDSITGIRGRRDLNADSIDTQQIGDDAITIQQGLKRILTTIRRHRIAVILTAHVRAELDRLEQMRGNDKKMAGSWALKHFAEYFMYVEPNLSKTGRSDLMGNDFIDDSVTDLMNKGERKGHKIRVTMKDSSVGPKGRVGEFTLDYDRGIINTYEEVFLLGVNRGLIERPNNVTYAFDGATYRGKPAILQALKDNADLYQQVLSATMKLDMEGRSAPAAASIGEKHHELPDAADLDGIEFGSN